MANIITEDYFKTAKEATMIFTVKNFKGWGDDYAFEGNAEFKIHITNFSHAEFVNIGGTIYLYTFPVLDSGSEYYPKLTVYINDTETVNTQLQCRLGYDLFVYNRDINYIKNRWDFEAYPELEALNSDTKATWDAFVGDGKNLNYEKTTITSIRECEGIEITDITGNGLLINGYLLYDYLTTVTPDEITFIDEYNHDDYIDNSYLKTNGSIKSFFDLPKSRIDADTDKIFSWPYYATNALQGLGVRTDVRYEGHWCDGDARAFMIINIINGMLDYINVTGNYHKFRGIQWDVWLDGNGVSMAITIVPTIKGTLPDKTYPIVNYGKQIATPWQHADFNSPPFRIELHDEQIDTTWGKISDAVTQEVIPTLFNIAIKCAYIDYKTNKVNGEIVGVIPSLLPDTVEEMPDTRTPDGKNVMKVANDGFSTIIFHFGLYDGDKYDDNDDITDDIEDSDGYNGVGLLTTQYALTSKRTQQLGWKLWGASFVELIEKVNNNPIENIISLKVFPRDFTGDDEVVKLGNVEMDVNGAKITNDTYSYKWDIGAFTVRKKYNSFLDFTPFTKVSIWLPFIGLKDLDTSLFMGKTVSLRYIVDIITGACKAELRYNGALLTDFEGSMGIDVSLTASNRAQVEAAFISNTVSSVTRNIGGIAGGGAGMASEGLDTNFSGGGGKGAIVQGIANIGSDLLQSALNQYHTTSGGSPSPSCSAYQTRDAYLIYDRPTYQDLKAFNMTHGRMCMLSRSLGTLKGFTKCNAMIDLSGIPCTEEERSMLLSILSSGFFINH